MREKLDDTTGDWLIFIDNVNYELHKLIENMEVVEKENHYEFLYLRKYLQELENVEKQIKFY